ncbi:hypothetical protein Bca101_021757 [Brassica carinata]
MLLCVRSNVTYLWSYVCYGYDDVSDLAIRRPKSKDIVNINLTRDRPISSKRRDTSSAKMSQNLWTIERVPILNCQKKNFLSLKQY